MVAVSEQCVKYCFLISKHSAETIVKLKKVHNNVAEVKSQVSKWFSLFKNIEMAPDKKLCCGRPQALKRDKNIGEKLPFKFGVSEVTYYQSNGSILYESASSEFLCYPERGMK